jgi:hypothetical protein
MKKILILFAVLSLFLFGCQNGQQGVAGPSFVGGTNGLLINFLQDAPPDNVYDNSRSTFQVAVQVKNAGEWDIDTGKLDISLSGIDPVDFSNPAMTKKSDTLISATKKDSTGTIIQGSQLVFTFPGFTYKGNLPGDINHIIKADACYAYGTKALSSICIKKDLTKADTIVCTVNSDRIVANSGAPVQVASIRESAGGSDSILLTITLKQTGTGEIFRSGKSCAAGIDNENVVNFKINTGMTSELSCSGLSTGTGTVTGDLTLYNGERQITCTQKTGGQGDFEKTVEITLSYDHRVSTSKTVIVKGN